MKKKMNGVLGLALALVLAVGLTPTALAAKTVDPAADKGSLTITLTDLDKKTPVSGVKVTVYQVGVGRVEQSNLYFDLQSVLADIRNEDGKAVTLNGLTAADNTKNAAALKAAIQALEADAVPAWSGQTDADGKVVLTDLPVGAYLLVSEKTGRYQETTPFLLTLPQVNAEGTEWEADVTANPKVKYQSSHKPEPENPPETPPEEPPHDIPDDKPPTVDIPEETPLILPQTGLLRWPIPVMAMAGVVLVALGAASERKRKNGQ